MSLILVTRSSQFEMPTYGSRSMPEDLVVGASPFVLVNTNNFGVRVFIAGGTVSDVSFQSEPWPDDMWKSCGTPQTIVLNALDSLQVTYSVAPTMSWTAF